MKKKVHSSLHCLPMLVMKHFNTHNVWPRNISEPLTPKTKLSDNRFYMNCVKRYLLCANQWLRWCFDSSCVWTKASKVLTVSVSVFRRRISWRFSLSKNNISPAASDLELILFPLWYWPIMNAHTKQQQDKVFQTYFIDSQKSNPPFAHLLALSHIQIHIHTHPQMIRGSQTYRAKSGHCRIQYL